MLHRDCNTQLCSIFDVAHTLLWHLVSQPNVGWSLCFRTARARAVNASETGERRSGEQAVPASLPSCRRPIQRPSSVVATPAGAWAALLALGSADRGQSARAVSTVEGNPGQSRSRRSRSHSPQARRGQEGRDGHGPPHSRDDVRGGERGGRAVAGRRFRRELAVRILPTKLPRALAAALEQRTPPRCDFVLAARRCLAERHAGAVLRELAPACLTSRCAPAAGRPPKAPVHHGPCQA